MGDTVATATSQERRERLLAEFQAWWKEHLATSDKTAAKQRAIGEAKDWVWRAAQRPGDSIPATLALGSNDGTVAA